MTTIHILDKNTDALVGFLDNEGPNMYWDDVHVRDLRNNEETFSFVMPSTIQEAGKIAHRSRLLIPDGRGAFREFIVFDENTSINYQKAIVSTATYMDLDKQFILPPGTYTGTVVEHLALVLPNTEWQAGTIEYAGIRTITIDDYTGAYSYILKLLSAFESEVNFRVETNGNQIVGRYVDFLERIGEVTQKEIEIGKDLVDMEMRIYSDRVVTALLCVGPEKSDGTRLTTIVVDDDAFQRWNRNGKHVFGLYEPESSNADMTLEQLQQYGRTELNKRIAAVVEYRVTAQKLNEAHEAVNIGDTVRIKNPRFVPALYANARIVRVERSIADDRLTVYEIGEVVLYDVNSINKTLANMRALYDKRIAMKNANHKQATKPDLATSVDGDRWENTAENNRIYTFSSTIGDYEPTDLGSEALNILQVSDISGDLGTIVAGDIYGANIYGATITADSVINVGTDVNVGQNIYLGNGLTAATDRYIRFGDTANFAGVNNSLDIRGSARIFYTNPDGETWIDQSLFFEEPLSATVETGFCGFGAPKGNVATVGYTGVNFKQKKNYVPSSVTLTKVDGNAESVAINNLTEVGFILIVISASATAGSNVDWRGYYSA